MSLQTRLTAFAQAVGADIKALRGPKTLVSDTPDPTSIAGSASDNAIQWVRASDGAWVAKIDPYLSGSIQTLEVKSRAKTDGQSAQANLIAEENGTFNTALGLWLGGEYSALEVSYADSGTAEPRGKVTARAGGQAKKILASDGSSDFMLPGALSPTIKSFAASNPADITGTFKNHPDGTYTITAAIAGRYVVALQEMVTHAASYQYENTMWTIGGTATRLDVGGSFDSWMPSAGMDGNRSGYHVAVFDATAGQTMTFLPRWRLGAASGTVSSHNFAFILTWQRY